jgi:hypothetical protein
MPAGYRRSKAHGGCSGGGAAAQAWADSVVVQLSAGAPGPALAKNAALQAAMQKPLLALVLVDPGHSAARRRRDAEERRRASAARPAYAPTDSELLLAVDWPRVVRNVANLFVLWTTTAADDDDATADAEADTHSSTSGGGGKADEPPEAVARVRACVRAALRGETVDDDAASRAEEDIALADAAARCQAAGVAASEAGLSAQLRRCKGKLGLYTHAHVDEKTGEKAVEVAEVVKQYSAGEGGGWSIFLPSLGKERDVASRKRLNPEPTEADLAAALGIP